MRDFFSFIIIIFIKNIHSTLFVFDPNNSKNFRCFFKFFESDDKLSISFQITGGYYTDLCKIELFDQNGNFFYRENHTHNGRFDVTVGSSLTYTLCFRNINSQAKLYVNFEFSSRNEQNTNYKNFAKDCKINKF